MPPVPEVIINQPEPSIPLSARPAAEKPPQRENPPRRLNPFLAHRARNRRHVDPKLIGHLNHRQRPQKLRALVEELALGVHHLPDYPHDRALALLDALDQPAG